MINKTDIRLQRFASVVLDTLFSDNDIGIVPQFYMTNYCNLSCPGCYMNARPNRPKVCIPTADIDFYLREFTRVPDFDGNVVFSGGEVFSLPTEYLKCNIQNALGAGLYLEVKTNGSWVDSPKRSNQIFKMLADLSVTRVPNVTEAALDAFMRRYSQDELRSMGRDVIYKKVCETFGTVATFCMAVSVDNKIHPGRSAQWFAKIANRIGRDDNLAQKIDLKSFCFIESMNFFQQNIIDNPQLGVSDFHNHGGVYSYRIGKCQVRSFLGDFIDCAVPVSPEKSADIVVMRPDMTRFVTFFFWPDRTVSFENCALRPVGRVPYVDVNGKCKCLNQLVQDMAIKMISDYKKSICR